MRVSSIILSNVFLAYDAIDVFQSRERKKQQVREYERESSRKRICVDDRWITTDLGRGISCKDRIVLNECADEIYRLSGAGGPRWS